MTKMVNNSVIERRQNILMRFAKFIPEELLSNYQKAISNLIGDCENIATRDANALMDDKDLSWMMSQLNIDKD